MACLRLKFKICTSESVKIPIHIAQSFEQRHGLIQSHQSIIHNSIAIIYTIVLRKVINCSLYFSVWCVYNEAFKEVCQYKNDACKISDMAFDEVSYYHYLGAQYISLA